MNLTDIIWKLYTIYYIFCDEILTRERQIEVLQADKYSAYVVWDISIWGYTGQIAQFVHF